MPVQHRRNAELTPLVEHEVGRLGERNGLRYGRVTVVRRPPKGVTAEAAKHGEPRRVGS